ncbi:MAG: hypothetical protein WAW41_10665 [Methylobacter sp.]
MSMAINTTNSTLLYKAIGNVQPSNSNVQTTRLSSGNRIGVASDDTPSPSVTVKLSPEAMALQQTTTVLSPSAVISESDYASDSARSGLQVRNTLSTVMLDQENQGAKIVMQLLK